MASLGPNELNLNELRILIKSITRVLLTSSAKIGRKMVAVAVLLATSVNAAVMMQRARTRLHVGMPWNVEKASPIITDKPDCWNKKENVKQKNKTVMFKYLSFLGFFNISTFSGVMFFEAWQWWNLDLPCDLWQVGSWKFFYFKEIINGLVQERCNSSALAMELRLSCTNPSISWNMYCLWPTSAF